MAAGAGSRFGGLKQITPVGPNEEFIMDYSIYDAIKAGFTKVIFVISPHYETYFRQTIGARIEDKIEVQYAYQQLDDVPEGYQVPPERKKPWGTGHALYSAKDLIKGPFAVINSDDFYGRDAYELLIDFMKHNESRNHYVSICYKVKNTLSPNGDVKRGIVKAKAGVLEGIIESTVKLEKGSVIAYPLDGSHPFKINDDDLTAVNLFGFPATFIKVIKTKFSEFLEKNVNDLNSEYLLPNVLEEEIQSNTATVYVKQSVSKCFGMTYKEDMDDVKLAIRNQITEGIYPRDLWE